MRVILGVFSLFALAGCQSFQARIEASKAFNAYEKKDYAASVEHYKIALTHVPDKIVLQKNLGFAELALAQDTPDQSESRAHYNQAVNHLFGVLRAHPEDKELATILVDAWTQTDRLPEAANYYKEYLGKFPNDGEAWRLLGQIEAHRGNYAGALESYEKRQNLYPNDIQISVGKAILCWEWLRSGSSESPEKALEIATLGLNAALQSDAKDPKHPTALVYAGLLLRQRAVHQKDSKASHQDLLEAQRLLEKVRNRHKGA